MGAAKQPIGAGGGRSGGHYKEQSRIEADFRALKSFIEPRPVYHHTQPRVRAHVFVCVLAKLLVVELERRLTKTGTKKFTVRRALEILKQLRATRVTVGHEERWLRTELNDDMRSVLAALDVTERSLPIAPGGRRLVVPNAPSFQQF